MARQVLQSGTVANDGTGDTLRGATTKINANFSELYTILGGDATNASVFFEPNNLVFEGSSVDDHETRLTVTQPTQDNVITMPDSTGTMILTTAHQTLTNKKLVSPVLVNADLYDSVGANNFYELVPPTASGMTKNINLNIPTLADSDTLITNTSTSIITGTKRYVSPILRNPHIGTQIQDSGGNPILGLPTVASAVNFPTINSNTTGNDISIVASGTDANINMVFEAKGTGTVKTKAFRFEDSDYTASGAAAISLTAPVALLNKSGAGTNTLANGVGGQIMRFVNINSGAVTITPATFAQGTTFTVQGKAAIDAVYNTTTAGSATVGWYLVGLDSSGGLGSQVIIA
jgi:hypothetical protein